ncbi:WD40 repeat-like protein [Lentithecium fluviatile CBS 122367]|uniref:WD40 repeat-like protein n=1 Tax=Lentithecium fluviatile CBS 122367 TaxID=1168545 RepID=A0A6G1JD31_9PLEO|nr:WD40 repeat-like protein [Lentithecium fluviatile CBS 122367]
MDPVSAVSLAAAIFQFVDFASKIVYGTRQIYGAGAGAVAENADVELCTIQLRDFCTKVQSTPRPSSFDDEDEAALYRLADRCVSISNDLLLLLGRVKAKDPSSKWHCMVAAVKSQLSKSERDGLIARLSYCRSQLDTQLCRLDTLDTKVFHDRVLASLQANQDVFKRFLEQIQSVRANVTISALSTGAEAQLQRMLDLPERTKRLVTCQRVLGLLQFEEMHEQYDDIRIAHQGTFVWALNDRSILQSKHASASLAQLETCPDLLPLQPPSSTRSPRASTSHSPVSKQKALYPVADIESSDHHLNTATKTSHKLPATASIVHVENDNIFTEWLRSGEGIFHISGIPGSGKSTFMKHVCDNPRTMNLLQEWATPKELTFAKFFLCRTGSRRQKSLAGLCRTLLHDILEACPELIPKALPDLWEHIDALPWQADVRPQIRGDRIRQALDRVFMDDTFQQSYRFAIFVDGLDECEDPEANHVSIIELLRSWTESGHRAVKICVSGGLQFDFISGFNNHQRLLLHEWTASDQRAYVLDQLRTFTSSERYRSCALRLKQALRDEEARRKLAELIIHRANGDFRWLSLALRRFMQMLDGPRNSLPSHTQQDPHAAPDNEPGHLESPSAYPRDRIGGFTSLDDIFLPKGTSSRPASTEPNSSYSSNSIIATHIAPSHVLVIGDSQDHTRMSQINDLEKFLMVPNKFEDDLFATQDVRMSGTCEWFSKKHTFLRWKDFACCGPKILWLTGKPATGKSTLSGYIVDELRRTSLGCSYFYFKHADKAKSVFGACLRVLALQMALKYPLVRARLVAIMNKSAGRNSSNDSDRTLWHKLFMEGIFNASLENQYWVIDGLDECEDSAAAFKMLLSKIDDKIPLRILITSRETLELRSEYNDIDSAHCIKETVSTSDTLQDLQILVEAKARILASTHEGSEERLVDTILSKSKGSFLWTTLVLKELSLSCTEEEISQVLADVPRGMAPLYQRLLETMSRSVRGKSLTKAILTWTTCAMQPLKLEELSHALSIDIKETIPNLEASIGALCGQLVTIDKSGKVQMVHETAREFLLDDALQSEFAIDRRKAHTQVAIACLRYLTGTEMKVPRSTRRVGASDATKTRGAFSSYAAFGFSFHLSQADSNSRELLILLDRFFETTILSWIEMVARTSDLTLLLRASKDITIYLGSCVMQKEVRSAHGWTTDLIRIPAKFADALIACPAAIYSLVPPFCPTSSAIYKTMNTNRRLSVAGLPNAEWDDRLTCFDFQSQATAVCFGDSFFAVGLSSGIVCLYHAVTGQEYRTLRHNESVSFLHIIDSLGLVVSCGMKSIHVWNVTSGQSAHTYEAPKRCVGVDYSDGVLIIACDKNYLASWDLIGSATRKPDKPWYGDPDCTELLRRPPSAISISTKHRLLAVAYPGRAIILWDLEADIFCGTCGKRLAGGQTSKHLVTALVFNPNPALELLAASYLDGDLVLFDPFADVSLETVRANCPKLAASPDGRLLAGAAGAGIIDIYGFESLNHLYRIQSSNLYIKSLSFSRDSLYLIDIRGSQCNVWEMHRVSDVDGISESNLPCAESVVSGSKIKVTALRPSTRGGEVFAGKNDGSVSVYNLETGMCVRTLYCHKSQVHILAQSSTGDLILSVDAANSIFAWRIDHSPKAGTVLGDRVLQARLDCGKTITQLLLNSTSENIILSTRESDHLWSLKQQQDISSQRHGQSALRKWVQHPLSPRHVMCIDGPTVRVYSWHDLQMVGCFTTTAQIDRLQPKSALRCSANGREVIIVEHSELHGAAATRDIHLLYVDSFFLDVVVPDHNSPTKTPMALPTTVSIHTTHPRGLCERLSHIIGISDAGKLIFLDKSSWVCSIDIAHLQSNGAQYLRHFFVPYDWFSGTREFLCAISGRNVLFARNDHVAIVKGGLDYSEIVTLSGSGKEVGIFKA